MFVGSVGLAAEAPFVLAHPPFDAFYACTEHFAGQFESVGDALGTDCVVQRLETVEGRTWLRSHRRNGIRNEDWYGWHEPVLSPCDCEVVRVQDAATENEPGVPGRPPAAYLVLRGAEDVHFMLAHVRDVAVGPGTRVKAGQPIAKVGNNGFSRNPHLHLGAWRGEQPLQIRFDQRRMRLPPEHR